MRLFSTDFSKAFDSVKIISCPPSLNNYMYLHILLIVITVFYPVDSNTFCPVTITVGGKPSIRVPHKVVLVAPISFNIFLNDVEITYDGFPAFFKYADDSVDNCCTGTRQY